MPGFIPWNSQPLYDWASKYAPGKFIELDGLSTHYIEKGSGEPVILLHGFFYDTYMWNKNIDALAERYKVYAFDLWGFGPRLADRLFAQPTPHQLFGLADIEVTFEHGFECRILLLGRGQPQQCAAVSLSNQGVM